MKVVGRGSGIVMDLPESLARALLRNGSAREYREPGAAPAPAEPERAESLPEADPGDPLACDECGMVARTAAGLSAHKRARHG